MCSPHESTLGEFTSVVIYDGKNMIEGNFPGGF